METIPWFSTFTLITEAAVTASVVYILYSGFYKNKFPAKLTAATLGYELLFNISYMTYRAVTHNDGPAHPHSTFHLAVAIFHGTFSLLMFLLLIVFMIFAWRGYKQGINFFQKYKKTTVVFLTAWMIAILSGFLFYYESYLTKN